LDGATHRQLSQSYINKDHSLTTRNAYIYLDWNVFKYIKSPRNDNNYESDVEFSGLINKLSNKYIIPFSEGHLADLMVSWSEENKNKVDSDLDLIKKITKEQYIKIHENNFDFYTVDPVIGFYRYKSEVEEHPTDNPSINISGNPLSIDTSLLHSDELLAPFIKENNGTLDPITFHTFLLHVRNNIDDPNYYNLFRENIFKLNERFSNRDTVIDKNSEYFKSILPLLNFTLETDESIIKNTILSVGQSLGYISGYDFNQISLPRKIQILYGILDFNFHLKEKVNKKNKPLNMHRDGLNLINALYARYYVTEDRNTKIKSEIVLKALEQKLPVLTMKELLHRFN
jgi:hypothetical protein